MYTQLYILNLKNCRSTSVLLVVIHKSVNLQVGGRVHSALRTPKNYRSISFLSVVIHKVVNLQVGGPSTQSSTHT